MYIDFCSGDLFPSRHEKSFYFLVIDFAEYVIINFYDRVAMQSGLEDARRFLRHHFVKILFFRPMKAKALNKCGES